MINLRAAVQPIVGLPAMGRLAAPMLCTQTLQAPSWASLAP
ncbi:Uncharacterized protein PPKH_0607 [Pseudomonas putida]|nr:Uncharacterized protein PPKH_0607 [Pseudomonas putida]